MGSGPHGAAGAPAACPAGEAAGRGRATAPTQPRSLGGTSVREVTYKWIFATAILAQVSALGWAVCPLSGFGYFLLRKKPNKLLSNKSTFLA